jgi:hypothetical protein
MLPRLKPSDVAVSVRESFPEASLAGTMEP